MKQLAHQSPTLITRRDACARYSISMRTVDNLINDGILPVVRFGPRFIRIPVQKADKAMTEPAKR